MTRDMRETCTAVLCILALAALASLLQPMDSEGADLRYYLSGPVSMTAHSPHGDYEDVHPGLGLEVQASPDAASPWPYGLAAHYMAEDSHSLPCWWLGATGGYTLGDRQGWWIEPGLIAGAISKPGLYNGDLGPLVLPRLALGYDMLSLDLSYIPAMRATGNTAVGYMGLRWRFWGSK